MELSQDFLILVPITIGLVQVVKKAGLSSRYAPLFAIVASCVIGFFLIGGKDAIAESIIAGLTAMGMYSGGKAVMQ